MAYLVGCLLVVLVCVGLPLKYGPWHNDTVVLFTAIPHGWLYMILLITAFDLGRRARWRWIRLLLIALAGTVPFLSFVAERSATKDVRAKLAAQEADIRPSSTRPRIRRPRPRISVPDQRSCERAIDAPQPPANRSQTPRSRRRILRFETD